MSSVIPLPDGHIGAMPPELVLISRGPFLVFDINKAFIWSFASSVPVNNIYKLLSLRPFGDVIVTKNAESGKRDGVNHVPSQKIRFDDTYESGTL